MRILDKYLVKSFIPPFLLATFIALFVLIMQTLWLYIDDILGKGADLPVVLQLLFYLSMSLVPMSLPIGVLLSSVMLFGNLSERFELSSMKSIGLSLLRILRPLIVVAAVISLFSYIFYDSIIPYSNLKFKSRLYDLSKQKPTLNLEEQAFNTDFKGFNIYFRKKDPDGKHIHGVIIYQDNKNKGDRKLNVITAATGEMFNTSQDNYFILKLYDGHIYRDMSKERSPTEGSHPFGRTHFKEWMKVFDLSEFELDRTNEELFKSHQTMKNSSALRRDIDSFQNKVIYYEKQQVRELRALQSQSPNGEPQLKKKEGKGKSTLANYRQLDTLNWANISSLYETFPPDVKVILARKLLQSTTRKKERLRSYRQSKKRLNKKIKAHVYELNIKYSFSLACLVFLFIGAPMGAIIRKGGFGYPLLISVAFFVVFILSTIVCKKLMETDAISAFWAAWIPLVALIPIGSVLTYQALMDARFEWIGRLSLLVKKKEK